MKNPLTVAMYLLVVLGALALFYLLYLENKAAMSLIKHNQSLLKNTVVKTLENNISRQLKHQPINLKDIATNWQKLPLNIQINYRNQWVFPHRFRGTNHNHYSPLWQHYGLSKEPASQHLPPPSAESARRIDGLNHITQALRTNDTDAVKQHTSSYFALVENYPLSPLEEVISTLKFLQLDDDSKWNRPLVELLIFTGSEQLDSLSHYLFKHNQQFTKADTQEAINMTLSVLHNHHLEAEWFQQSVKALWTESLDVDMQALPDFTVIDKQWIVVETAPDLKFLLPFSINHELQQVEHMLTTQGILSTNDVIITETQPSDASSIAVEQLPIRIAGPGLQQQIDKQNHFFYIKLLLVLAFMLSLLIVVSFIAYRNKKKSELIALRENFVNLVSHELKTPLASIRVMTETLHKRNQRNLSIKNYPEKITHEVDKLWLMVDNLLSLNQIKAGKSELITTAVNLSDLIDRVHEQFTHHCTTPLLVNNAVPKNLTRTLDPILMELVFSNLFSNAIKYNNQTKTQLEITAQADSNQIQLIDNGCGIDVSQWERVFEDFYRADHKQQGTGIGLFLCRQIMALHGGQISIGHSDQHGTTWLLDLPPSNGVDVER